VGVLKQLLRTWTSGSIYPLYIYDKGGGYEVGWVIPFANAYKGQIKYYHNQRFTATSSFDEQTILMMEVKYGWKRKIRYNLD
jgi:hypothetical protein